MITVKNLMQSQCSASPDGTHWEPCLSDPRGLCWQTRLRDAWAVWKGEATAIRQTTKADIEARLGITKGEA